MGFETPRNVRTATPCRANWHEMEGAGRVRFCALCKRNVYDLSVMTRDEAEVFVSEREGAPVAGLYERTDGMVMASDCPVGMRAKRNGLIASGAVLVGMLALVTVAWSMAWREMSIFPDPIADHVADEGVPIRNS